MVLNVENHLTTPMKTSALCQGCDGVPAATNQRDNINCEQKCNNINQMKINSVFRGGSASLPHQSVTAPPPNVLQNATPEGQGIDHTVPQPSNATGATNNNIKTMNHMNATLKMGQVSGNSGNKCSGIFGSQPECQNDVVHVDPYVKQGGSRKKRQSKRLRKSKKIRKSKKVRKSKKLRKSKKVRKSKYLKKSKKKRKFGGTIDIYGNSYDIDKRRMYEEILNVMNKRISEQQDIIASINRDLYYMDQYGDTGIGQFTNQDTLREEEEKHEKMLLNLRNFKLNYDPNPAIPSGDIGIELGQPLNDPRKSKLSRSDILKKSEDIVTKIMGKDDFI